MEHPLSNDARQAAGHSVDQAGAVRGAADQTDRVFIDDVEHSRYVLRSASGSLLSAIDYHRNGEVVALTHVFTPPPLRGRGLAAEIVLQAAEHLDSQGLRTRPTCWYAAGWFERHGEWAHLLA